MAILHKPDQKGLLPPGISLSDVTQFLEKTPHLDSDVLRRRRAIMEVLLDSVCPILHQPKGLFASLWAEEANHRAIKILQLLLYNQSVSRFDESAINGEEQHKQAMQLAAEFVKLRQRSAHQTLFCADVVTNIINGIFNVFKHSCYPIKPLVSVGNIRLSACKLQALSLICCEAAFNALKLGFDHQSSGEFRVDLNRVENSHVLIALKIDVSNAHRVVPESSYRLVSKLGSVLDAETTYRITKCGGARLEMLFSSNGLRGLVPTAIDTHCRIC